MGVTAATCSLHCCKGRDGLLLRVLAVHGVSMANDWYSGSIPSCLLPAWLQALQMEGHGLQRHGQLWPSAWRVDEVDLVLQWQRLSQNQR
jgi:hypothetical protein